MKTRFVLVSILFTGLLAGCIQNTPTPNIPDLSATLLVLTPMAVTDTVQPTAQPTAPQPHLVTATPNQSTPVPAPTLVPTTAPVPTRSSQPTAQPPAAATAVPLTGATRLSFDTGGTSTLFKGFIAGGTTQKFVVKALAGQVMMLATASPNNNIFMAVTRVGNSASLLSLDKQWTNWWGTLPETDDYLIQVYAGGGNANYSLSVVIPQRISFDAGATSAKVKGTVVKGAVNTYLVNAGKGQKMTVTLTSPNKDVVLSIYGLEGGEPLVRSAAGVATWTGSLPRTQDYVVQAVSTGGATDYTVEVVIP